MSNEILSFRQSGNKLNMFNLFPLCRKDEISFDFVAVSGNKVERCFNIVAFVDGAVGGNDICLTISWRSE